MAFILSPGILLQAGQELAQQAGGLSPTPPWRVGPHPVICISWGLVLYDAFFKIVSEHLHCLKLASIGRKT